MGTDKAEVVFRGRTLLEIAVSTMAEVTDDVIVVGTRDQVPAGAVCIADRHPGCGPMGGIEAALHDCRGSSTEYAVFLPVDMPLLPSGLLQSLTELWRASEAVRVAVTVADGRVQPLVSMIHVDVLSTLSAALERGDHKLQPALHAAGESLADNLQVPVESAFVATGLEFGDRVVLTASGEQLSWLPRETEWERRKLWFANLNRPEELQRVSAGAVNASHVVSPGQ